MSKKFWHKILTKSKPINSGKVKIKNHGMSPSHKFGELGMGGQKDDEVYPSVVKGAHRRGGTCTPLTLC